MSFFPMIEQQKLCEGYVKSFLVDGVSVLLVRQQGKVSAVENRCPHMDAPLEFGKIHNGNIRCPLHGMEFSLASGAGVSPAFCTGGLKVFQVAIVDSVVGVNI